MQKVIRLVKWQAREIRMDGFPEILRKTLVYLLLPLALLVVLLVRVLRPIVLVRFGDLMSGRIGYSAHMDMYLCERDAGLHGSRIFDIFSHVYWYRSVRDKHPVANKQMNKMWNRALPVYRFAALLNFVSLHLPGSQKHLVPQRPRLADRDMFGVYAGAKPHLSFTSHEERFGASELNRLGIPEGAPFICFYAWDPAYVETLFPHIDSDRHKYRNNDIHSYLPAVEELVARGYHALRMGSIVKEALRSSNPLIIDYATKFRTDFLDIYLSAKCRFFISSYTGLDAIPCLFRRPRVWVNLAPLERLNAWDPTHLFIPKKLWLKGEGRLMPFREILESGAGNLLLQEDYDKRGIEVIDNTPEEIAHVALEMDDRLLGTWRTTEEDEELQRQFWQVLETSPLSTIFISRVGAHFLRQNRDLLE